MTPGELIKNYLQLRRKVEEIKERHKDELSPFTNVMEMIEAKLLDHLNTTGADNLKAPAGTAYKSTSTSVTVSDWAQTLAFIRKHDLWDLLEARVAKTAALETIEERKAPIPGVKIDQAIVLRVRAG